FFFVAVGDRDLAGRTDRHRFQPVARRDETERLDVHRPTRSELPLRGTVRSELRQAARPFPGDEEPGGAEAPERGEVLGVVRAGGRAAFAEAPVECAADPLASDPA